MPISCCAVGCTNRFVKGSVEKKSFFRLPLKDVERLSAWLRAIGRVDLEDTKKTWVPKSTDRICSDHFIDKKPSMIKDHPDYVPSIFSHRPSNKKTPGKVPRYERSRKRQRTTSSGHNAATTAPPPDVDLESNAVDCLANMASLIEQSGSEHTREVKRLQVANDFIRQKNKSLLNELSRLQAENVKLGDKVEKLSFSAESMNSSKIQYYTGVPNLLTFMWIVELVCGLLKPRGNFSIPNQVLMTLYKIRHNIGTVDLAYRFSVSPSTISRTLRDTLHALGQQMEHLIYWPTKEESVKNMPPVIRKTYSKCCVIIDCSEVFIERATNFTARSKTWSNYKQHNTLKFLVGITPWGTVSFMSKAWGGRVSDKVITAQSGFYNKLEYGDVVLADRGFLIADELAVVGCTLAIPAFTRGKKQLHRRDVEMTRKLARVRIHVERAIERLKNFRIISGILPISLIKHADEILTVCAAITNLQPKLIK